MRVYADFYLEERKAAAARVRGASPGKFRIVMCSNLNGEATIRTALYRLAMKIRKRS